MEGNLKIKVLGAVAAGVGLVGVIAGAIGFLAGRSNSNLSAEQAAYEAGLRLATPRSAYVTLVRPTQCPDDITVQSLGRKINFKIVDGTKKDASGRFICEYTAERIDY